MAMNVMGTILQECSVDPLTGFFRDGCCNTGVDDLGVHTVCALVTEEFLAFSKEAGNDLSTPRSGFGGLHPGDRTKVLNLPALLQVVANVFGWNQQLE